MDEPHPCGSPPRNAFDRCRCCGVWFIRRDEGPLAVGYCGNSCYDANRFRQAEPDDRWQPLRDE